MEVTIWCLFSVNYVLWLWFGCNLGHLSELGDGRLNSGGQERGSCADFIEPLPGGHLFKYLKILYSVNLHVYFALLVEAAFVVSTIRQSN